MGHWPALGLDVLVSAKPWLVPSAVLRVGNARKVPEGLMANLEDRVVAVLAPPPFLSRDNGCFLEFILDVTSTAPSQSDCLA